MLIAALGAPASSAQSSKPGELKATGLDPDSTVSLPDKRTPVKTDSVATVRSADEEMVSVIVKLKDEPLSARADANGVDAKSAESQSS